jgi:hypothetical protein
MSGLAKRGSDKNFDSAETRSTVSRSFLAWLLSRRSIMAYQARASTKLPTAM